MRQLKINNRLKFGIPLIVILGLVLVGAIMASRYTDQAGSKSSTSSAQLKQVLEQITVALSLAHFNNVPPTPNEVIVKSAPAYYVATGVISMSEDIARTKITNTLASQNWTVIRGGNVDHFLGWEVIAARNSMVIMISAGEEAKGVPATPYRRLDGQTYVQMTIAAQNSGPEWSEIKK